MSTFLTSRVPTPESIPRICQWLTALGNLCHWTAERGSLNDIKAMLKLLRGLAK